MTRFARMLVYNDTSIGCDSKDDSDTPALGNRDVCAQLLQWLCAPTCMDSSLPPLLQLLRIETSRFLRGRNDMDGSEMDPQFLRKVLVASLLVCDVDLGEHPTNVKLWTKCVSFGITHALAYIVFRQRLFENGVEIRSTLVNVSSASFSIAAGISFARTSRRNAVCLYLRPNVILAMLVFDALRSWLAYRSAGRQDASL